MMRCMLMMLSVLATSSRSLASGLMIPEDAKLPPLALVQHHVTVTIQDQVAITTLEQTFRNHTDRNLEATYLFPVPTGASVNRFSMWVDGKETAGELLDAKQAHRIYTDIVRRTQDPGLLEYLDNNLMRMRIFPVPPRGEQKVKVSFTSVLQKEQGVVEYLYPFKTDGKTTQSLSEFSIRVILKSQHPIKNIYSPTHAIDTKRINGREWTVDFAKSQARLDRDFQLFFGLGDQEVGLTPLLYRPVSSEDGYFLLLVSPHLQATESRMPRDLVVVLDTSGSMSDLKMSQAKKALKMLLGQLSPTDRFGIVSFASTVRPYEEKLLEASGEQLEKAQKWVDDLRSGGGTAIQPALERALDFRGRDTARSFTVCFFTDGVPTIDERNPEAIVKNVLKRTASQENTRIFTFGVGDDVSATLLDRLAEETRAVSTYVRPAEDIELKASALNAKISQPSMTNVKLTTENVKVHELYPPQLPDLFQGSQLVVLGRFTGQGPAIIRLSGLIGGKSRELVFELDFPNKTDDRRDFVEPIWARRKVGYLLDQIRIHGESSEVVQEITSLAKKYGIATPYTSYLVVPDGPMPIIPRDPVRPFPRPPGIWPRPIPLGATEPPSIDGPGSGISTSAAVREMAKGQVGNAGGIAQQRGVVQDRIVESELKNFSAQQRESGYARALEKVQSDRKANADVLENWKQGQIQRNQQGKLGVDLAETSQNLRGQSRLAMSATRMVNGRVCVEIGGIWIDDQYNPNSDTITIQAQSEAYFQILELYPKMKELFRLGNHLVWITPSGTTLLVDPGEGRKELSETEIRTLFTLKANK